MNVLVYSGPGTSKGAVGHTLSSLKRELSDHYDVIPVDDTTLVSEPWEDSTVCLVIPGGRDIPYLDALSKTKRMLKGSQICELLPDLDTLCTTRIRNFVLTGGSYLGICAGAYFGCHQIKFEEFRPEYTVIGTRPLNFFQGEAIGSAFPGFEYESEKGGRMVSLHLDTFTLFRRMDMDHQSTGLTNSKDSKENVSIYFNGGPYFTGSSLTKSLIRNSSDLENLGLSDCIVTPLAWYSSHVIGNLPNKPAILQCHVGKGKAILSGVHIEYSADMMQQEAKGDEFLSKWVSNAQDAEEGRRKLWRALLHRLHLKLNEEKSVEKSKFVTPMYLACLNNDIYERIWKRISSVGAPWSGNSSGGDFVDTVHTFRFVIVGSNPSSYQPRLSNSRSTSMTVHVPLIHPPTLESIPTSSFNFELYFKHLKSLKSHFGSAILFGQIVESTQTILEGNRKFSSALPDGFVCLGSTQLTGKGRGSNSWISPPGCLQFSLLLRHSNPSTAVFFQYMMALAVVQGIRSCEGCSNLPVFIKWPNDVYANTNSGVKKIGGILVNSSWGGNDLTLVIGSGTNIANEYPPLSVNQLIADYNKNLISCQTNTTTTLLHPITQEEVLANILHRFELLYHLFNEKGWQGIEDQYYKVWLHSGQHIQITDLLPHTLSATIEGVDFQGLLMARRDDDGSLVSLQPDGNRFDMIKGLISRKL